MPSKTIVYSCGCMKVNETLYQCTGHTIMINQLDLRRMPLEVVENYGGRECYWTWETMLKMTREEYKRCDPIR